MSAITNVFLTVIEVFASITIGNIFDIAIVSVLIYFAFIFIKQTRSYFIFTSIVLVFGIVYISRQFDLGLTRQVFEPFLTFFLLIFVIVFQREIRRFFKWFSSRSSRLRMQKKISISTEVTEHIVRAINYLAPRNIGALIVVAGDHPIEFALRGGLKTESNVSAKLLANVFNKNNPSHDGAVIIRDNKIQHIGAHLPLAENHHIGIRMGTRHRAALGITEESDAMAIVVSEESGAISVAFEGSLRTIVDPNDLLNIVGEHNKEKAIGGGSRSIWHYLIFRNWFEKISAIGLAVFLWFVLVFQANIVIREFAIPIDFRGLSPEIALESTSENKVTTTISGRNADFENFDDKDLSAFIDLSEIETGVQTLTITEENINYPGYFTLSNYGPDKLEIEIREVIFPEGDDSIKEI